MNKKDEEIIIIKTEKKSQKKKRKKEGKKKGGGGGGTKKGVSSTHQQLSGIVRVDVILHNEPSLAERLQFCWAGPVDHVGRGSAGVADLRQTVHLCNNHTIMTW